MATARTRGERRPTFTEQARRTQLIENTIDLVAAHGFHATSLARIAESAQLTKAAVLYHFPSKDALVEAAYEQVLAALVAEVAAAVEGAGTAGGPAAYVRSMVGHLRHHPRHVRMLVEALDAGPADTDRRARHEPLAEIMAAAAGGEAGQWRTAAVVVSGAIDGIVAEQLADPGFDGAGAADQLVEFVEFQLARRAE